MCLHVPSKMGQLYCDSPRRQGIIHLSANKTNLQSSFSQDHGVKALNTTLHSGHDALTLQKLGIRLFCPHRNYYQCYTVFRESTEKFVSCTLEILTVMFKEMVVWAPFLKSNEKNLISKEHLMCSLFNRSVLSGPEEGVHGVGIGGLSLLLICQASPFLWLQLSYPNIVASCPMLLLGNWMWLVWMETCYRYKIHTWLGRHLENNVKCLI